MGLSRPQIAIEMPIGYLNLDGSTDYDFVLHHLLDNPAYRNWYKGLYEDNDSGQLRL